MVNNTQDKHLYYKHEVIARGTVNMTAEGETERLYEEVFPPTQQVNGVRQGCAFRRQPLKKVAPGTPPSPEEEALYKELNLVNRFYLRGKKQNRQRGAVRAIIA